MARPASLPVSPAIRPLVSINIDDIIRHSRGFKQTWREFEGDTRAASCTHLRHEYKYPLHITSVPYERALATCKHDEPYDTSVPDRPGYIMSCDKSLNEATLIWAAQKHNRCVSTPTFRTGIMYAHIGRATTDKFQVKQSRYHQVPLDFYEAVGYVPGINFSGVSTSGTAEIERAMTNKKDSGVDTIVKLIFTFAVVYRVRIAALSAHITAFQHTPQKYQDKHGHEHVQEMQRILQANGDVITRIHNGDITVLSAIDIEPFEYDIVTCPATARPMDIFSIVICGPAVTLPQIGAASTRVRLSV